MNNDFSKLLVEACRDSMRRCRWILSGVSIASLAVIAGGWNVYFSWVRTVVMQSQWGTPVPVEEAQKKLLAAWVESGYLTVPIIGGKLHIADVAFIGSLALTILIVWLYYSVSFQHHLVRKSLQHAKNYAADELKLYIYYGISAFHVFATIARSDEPSGDLEDKEDGSWIISVRAAYSAMFFLPVLSISFIIICDVLSMTVIGSGFRASNTPVKPDLLNTWDWAKLIFMEVFALGMAIYCGYLGYRCRKYNRLTIESLRYFAEHYVQPIKEKRQKQQKKGRIKERSLMH